MLTKRSGRTIEHLARNSDVIHLKCSSFEVPFITVVFFNQDSKVKTYGDLFPASFSHLPSDPLPAVQWDERVKKWYSLPDPLCHLCF